jgi:hypothetical protein
MGEKPKTNNRRLANGFMWGLIFYLSVLGLAVIIFQAMKA